MSKKEQENNKNHENDKITLSEMTNNSTLRKDKDMLFLSGFKFTIKKGENWENRFKSFVNGEIFSHEKIFLLTDLDFNPLTSKNYKK